MSWECSLASRIGASTPPELIRTAGTGSGAAQRELARLEDSGLIVSRRVGHQKHYQANSQAPLFDQLRGIVLKTIGLPSL